ncbi:MAG: hypothetical protein ACRDIY_01690 [Chloroflexota bacterium]
MRVFFIAILLAAQVIALALAPAGASAASCEYVLGFKAIHDLIPNVVGDCLTDEQHGVVSRGKGGPR